MRRKTHTTFISLVTTVVLFASLSLYFTRYQTFQSPKTHVENVGTVVLTSVEDYRHQPIIDLQVPSPFDSNQPDSILLPDDWEILLVSPPEIHIPSDSGNHFTCVFQNNDIFPATPAGILPFSNRTTFKCVLPERVRRLHPFRQPILASSPKSFPVTSLSPELFRWGFLAYESVSTENDVILFVKGVNNRQGVNRSPEELRCVFSNGANISIKTAVITSNKEVFRCRHPDESSFRRIGEENIKVSLEITNGNRKMVPSVVYYAPPRRNVVENKEKSLICACTMVYNVAKFLKEWVVYHAKVGVEKILLYDNGSDDELEKVVTELTRNGYDVETIYWPWSKTQEAGFSHCATHANNTCTWMLYTDVDEFIFSPSWLDAPHPSSHMLRSFLPRYSSPSHSGPIGQIMIRCYEFGPSNQRTHPVSGVTQGYTCRRRTDQRHKSMVLLEAVDTSLVNVVHHFELKRGYRVKKLRLGDGVVNHYKYQAWPEFRTKFRRRVSAYVSDWTDEANPKSKDRAPGLGYEPIEPKGWSRKFCDVHDYRLKQATRRWFGLGSTLRFKMAWQDLPTVHKMTG